MDSYYTKEIVNRTVIIIVVAFVVVVVKSKLRFESKFKYYSFILGIWYISAKDI